MPSLLSAGQSVVEKHGIIRSGARAGLSNGSIRIQQLSRQHANAIAGASPHQDLRPARGVLAHIVDDHARPRLSDAERDEPLGDHHRRNQMSRQLPSRRTGRSVRPCHFERRAPVCVRDKIRPVPPVLHPTGVEVLAAVDRRKGDWPRGGPPARVACQDCLGAVAILDVHLQDQFWLAKGPDELGVTAMNAGNVIHPVTKQDSKGVRARSKPPRHIEGVVQDRLSVVGPAGMEHGFGDVAPVQVKFVLSQDRRRRRLRSSQGR